MKMKPKNITVRQKRNSLRAFQELKKVANKGETITYGELGEKIKAHHFFELPIALGIIWDGTDNLTPLAPVEIHCQESSDCYRPLSKGIYPEFFVMPGAYKMTSKVEKSVDRRVDSQKSLCLCCRLEAPHHGAIIEIHQPLHHPGQQHAIDIAACRLS